jgi:hypothetical protein
VKEKKSTPGCPIWKKKEHTWMEKKRAHLDAQFVASLSTRGAPPVYKSVNFLSPRANSVSVPSTGVPEYICMCICNIYIYIYTFSQLPISSRELAQWDPSTGVPVYICMCICNIYIYTYIYVYIYIYICKSVNFLSRRST